MSKDSANESCTVECRSYYHLQTFCTSDEMFAVITIICKHLVLNFFRCFVLLSTHQCIIVL